ncbi:MAG: hypothetical protein GY765_00305 [bacterium]|nr:hypothetical protein [bacterium]
MNCKKTTLLLSKLLDGETSTKEESAISLHLEACTACRKEKEALKTVHCFLAPPQPIEPSAGFIARVKEEALREEPLNTLLKTNPLHGLYERLEQLKANFRLKPVLTGFACLLLFAASFFLGEKIGDKVMVKEDPQQIGLTKVLPTSVFADIPEGSIASAYYLAQQEY